MFPVVIQIRILDVHTVQLRKLLCGGKGTGKEKISGSELYCPICKYLKASKLRAI